MRLSYLNLAIAANTILASQFIVQLKEKSSLAQFLSADDSVSTSNHKNVKSLVQKTIKIGDSFEAFVGELDVSTINQLKNNPLVHDILPNLQVNIFADDQNAPPKDGDDKLPEEIDGDSDDNKDKEDDEMPKDDSVKIQENAPRHLARLSTRQALPNTNTKPLNYYYTTTGKGVVAYVIDTGIKIEDPQFEGRAVYGANFVVNETAGDLNGHGSHVAGIIGSKTYGVAKNVELVEVKVLDGQGSGSLMSILEGIQFAAEDREKRKAKAVANMSLGSVYSGILNDAVNAAFKTGLVMVSAAGNSNSRASFFSPSSAEDSITIGALDDRTDTIAPFSNYGAKVDVFASGVAVESIDINNPKAPIAFSGTSMASPVVAGLVATFLEGKVDSKAMKSKIIELSTKDAISMTKLAAWKYRKTPNRIAFNGAKDDGNYNNGEPIKKVGVIPFEQDQSLMKYLDDYNNLEPKDLFSMDLIERSRKIHAPDWE